MDQQLFRTAMSRLGAAVNLITTDGPAGRYGIVVSAVCSVTDTPPTLLVCINRGSGANAVIRANEALCVNILSTRHESLSSRFATAPAGERFDGTDLVVLETGCPMLADAAVALDCRIGSVRKVGSHSVFFATVADVRLHDDVDALMWFDRRFHRLSRPLERAR